MVKTLSKLKKYRMACNPVCLNHIFYVLNYHLELENLEFSLTIAVGFGIKFDTYSVFVMFMVINMQIIRSTLKSLKCYNHLLLD